MNKTKWELIIIGGGPAGLTAAIYSSRASIDTLVIEGSPHGGQLTLTTEVENFPGFRDGIMGPDLIENMRAQVQRFGATLLEQNVVSIRGDAQSNFCVRLDDGQEFESKAILVASGASAKWLDIESETRLRGKGVSACATCDGFFFKDKEVAVVGGGDSAMEEAIFLTKFASKVYVLVRSPKASIRASTYMRQKAEATPKVEFLYNTQVKEILGQDKVEGIVVVDNESGADTRMTNIGGVFIAIGHKPNTEFLAGFIELDELGYIKVSNFTKTSKDGVFACGDVSDRRYRQAVTAAGLGCMASLDVERYLAGH